MLVLYFGNSIYQIPFYANENYKTMAIDNEEMKYMKVSPYMNPLILSERGIPKNLIESLANTENITIDFTRRSKTSGIYQKISFGKK